MIIAKLYFHINKEFKNDRYNLHTSKFNELNLSIERTIYDFMAYCPACGTDNPKESSFCMNCGASIHEKTDPRSTQNRQTSDFYRSVDQERRARPEYLYDRPMKEDVHPLAYICACCVPLAGFVIWLVVKEQNPDSANTILIISIISFVVTFILGAGGV